MNYAIGKALGTWWGRQSRMSRLVFVMVALLALAYCVRSDPTPPTATAPPISAAAPAPQVIDPRDVARGTAARMVLVLRQSMKDPKSFELEEAYFMADDSACYTYFARNSFNARVRGAAVLAAGQLHASDSDTAKFRAAWKKHCDGPSGQRITNYVNQFVL